jgi:hypothetical protein
MSGGAVASRDAVTLCWNTTTVRKLACGPGAPSWLKLGSERGRRPLPPKNPRRPLHRSKHLAHALNDPAVLRNGTSRWRWARVMATNTGKFLPPPHPPRDTLPPVIAERAGMACIASTGHRAVGWWVTCAAPPLPLSASLMSVAISGSQSRAWPRISLRSCGLLR